MISGNEKTDGMVSVIVPVYNMEEYIGRTIDSIVGQTYENLEAIIVDDGSTDGTADILNRHAQQDARVRIIHKANGGVSSARNVGLANARGQYIAWLDADDWFEPEMIETLVGAMKRHNAQAALTNYENVHRDGKKLVRYQLSDAETVLERADAMEWLFSTKITQSVWGNVMERRLYEGIVFPEGRLFEDVSNVYKLYERAERVVMVDRLLMNRFYREESISHEKSLHKRVESCEAYMARQNDVVTRWPNLDPVFVRNNYSMLLLLRRAVLRSSKREFDQFRSGIREVSGYFRKNRRYVYDVRGGLGAKLELWLLTSGSYGGFWLARLVGAFNRQKKTWL